MNILQYITLPCYWIVSLFHYINPLKIGVEPLQIENGKLENSKLENISVNQCVEEFEIINPQYTTKIKIIRNCYVDEVIASYSDIEFIIERCGNYGVLYLYMSADQININLERLYIKRDDTKVYI